MGPSTVTTEGFILEIEADAENMLHLWIDGKDYPMKVRESAFWKQSIWTLE